MQTPDSSRGDRGWCCVRSAICCETSMRHEADLKNTCFLFRFRPRMHPLWKRYEVSWSVGEVRRTQTRTRNQTAFVAHWAFTLAGLPQQQKTLACTRPKERSHAPRGCLSLSLPTAGRPSVNVEGLCKGPWSPSWSATCRQGRLQEGCLFHSGWRPVLVNARVSFLVVEEAARGHTLLRELLSLSTKPCVSVLTSPCLDSSSKQPEPRASQRRQDTAVAPWECRWRFQSAKMRGLVNRSFIVFLMGLNLHLSPAVTAARKWRTKDAA